jgi:hypothetical protein
MRRREFIATLASATAWPLAARAQELGRTYRIGFLTPASSDMSLTGPTIASTPWAAAQNICFWHKADMTITAADIRFWG